MNTPGSYLCGNRCLHIRHSRQSVPNTEIQQHERCCRADEDRIYKNGYRLYKPLFNRMGHICCCSGIRCRPHTRFIGKQSALDAIHNTGACKASEDSLQIKGFLKYLCEYCRQSADIGYRYVKSQQNIQHCHDGNNRSHLPRLYP